MRLRRAEAAGATRDRGEDAAALAAAGRNDNLFGDVVAKLDAFADKWTRKIAETFADAFERSAVSYLSNAHLAGRFGAQDDATSDGNGNGDESRHPGTGTTGTTGTKTETKTKTKTIHATEGLGAEVMASPALSRPLRVLRDGLAVVRAALVAADAVDDGGGSCVQSATRVVAAGVRRILRRVVPGNKAGFTRTGASYFQRDVDAIRACFARAPAARGQLPRPVERVRGFAQPGRVRCEAVVAAVDAELRAGAGSRGLAKPRKPRTRFGVGERGGGEAEGGARRAQADGVAGGAGSVQTAQRDAAGFVSVLLV